MIGCNKGVFYIGLTLVHLDNACSMCVAVVTFKGHSGSSLILAVDRTHVTSSNNDELITF